MKVLITGGAGFIGSTTAKALEEAGHTPVILDSLLNGPLAFVRDRIFYEGDIADRDLLARVFDEHPEIEATIHMAARIKVPESVEQPYEYYRDNVAKSLELFDQLDTLGKPRVLFSSSASLYALKDEFEVVETDPLAPTSPYARTKLMMEMVLQDMAAATDLRAIILRYFNPIGSDPDLESGIYDKEPSHVLGQLVMAARGQKDALHDHRHRAPDPRRHRHPRLHPRVGPRPRSRRGGRAVRQGPCGGGRAERDHQRRHRRGCHRARADRRVRERVSARRCPYRRRRRVPVTPWAPSPTWTRRATCSAGRSSLSLEDAIDAALKWGEKRQSVLGYE